MERSFPRDIESLPGVFDLVREFFAAERIDAQHLFTADLVLEELFTNCVKHNPQGGGEIRVGLRREDDKLILSLSDSDTDFCDPREAQVARPDAPVQERKVGGLGIHLIRRMVDKIDYDHHGRQGRTVVVKKLDSRRRC